MKLSEIAEEILQEYKEKYDFYIDMARMAVKYEDEELYNLAMKRAAGSKMMIESNAFDIFIKK